MEAWRETAHTLEDRIEAALEWAEVETAELTDAEKLVLIVKALRGEK